MSTLEAQSLLAAAQGGDNAALEQMLEENAGLIWSIVRRYYGRGADPEDLYQLGCLGFIKAVRGFDFSYGCQFSTYAVPKIAGEIRRFLRDDGAVKVSRSVKEQFVQVRAARECLRQREGREPTLSELAQETGISPEEIAVAEDAARPVTSLEAQMGDAGSTLEHFLGSEPPEPAIVEKLTLRAAIDGLPERERQVIFLRYFKDMTQENIARILGISQVQVSRIERRAVVRLRATLE